MSRPYPLRAAKREGMPSGAKALDIRSLKYGLKPVPFQETHLSATCLAVSFVETLSYRGLPNVPLQPSWRGPIMPCGTRSIAAPS